MFWVFFNSLYAWLPLSLRAVVAGIFVVFLIWVVTGIIKRLWDIVPFL